MKRLTTVGAPRWMAPTAAIVAAFALVSVFLAITGTNVPNAARALLSGAFGSRYAILSASLVRAIPLILTGLAIAWAFTANVFNIGVEGQFLVGAAAATATGLAFPSGGHGTLLLSLMTGAVAGGCWAGIAAWLKVRFSVLEVISTIMLNFVAIQLIAYLVHGPLGDPKGIYPQSPTLASGVWMPKLVPGTRLHWGFAIALIGCGIAWFVKGRMASGFRLRLVGANPGAAWISGGVAVEGVVVRAFLVSGAIAGLAGAVEVHGVTYALYESISPGYGYTAIAVALLANLNPLGVVVSGIGFGALEAGAAAMQRDAGVPAVIASVIEATVILVIAALRLGERKTAVIETGTSAPAAAS